MDTVSRISFVNKQTNITLNNEDIIFCYVKDYCPWSKKACKRLLKLNHPMKCYDLKHGRFVCPRNFEKKLDQSDISKYFKYGLTVPQIFILNSTKKPVYIGGYQDLVKTSITSNAVVDVKNSPIQLQPNMKF